MSSDVIVAVAVVASAFLLGLLGVSLYKKRRKYVPASACRHHPNPASTCFFSSARVSPGTADARESSWGQTTVAAPIWKRSSSTTNSPPVTPRDPVRPKLQETDLGISSQVLCHQLFRRSPALEVPA
eukprot:scaffold100_cov271-Pinguiococcus_pyrenoidosus.AAC.3